LLGDTIFTVSGGIGCRKEKNAVDVNGVCVIATISLKNHYVRHGV
jgi:hypothetical protein